MHHNPFIDLTEGRMGILRLAVQPTELRLAEPQRPNPPFGAFLT